MDGGFALPERRDPIAEQLQRTSSSSWRLALAARIEEETILVLKHTEGPALADGRSGSTPTNNLSRGSMLVDKIVECGHEKVNLALGIGVMHAHPNGF